MLQRTPHTLVYLSATELGITERERAGLIEVRDDLASGRVKHVEVAYPIMGKLDKHSTSFNMYGWTGISACGTCHCIGGFMDARDVWDGSHWGDVGSKNLGVLFCPLGVEWKPLTPVQAVRAIDHFLAGAGAECWPMALADDGSANNEV